MVEEYLPVMFDWDSIDSMKEWEGQCIENDNSFTCCDLQMSEIALKQV